MTERSGKVTVDHKGRRLQGNYVVFGDRVTVESGGHTKTASYSSSFAGAEMIARIMLREMADEGEI